MNSSTQISKRHHYIPRYYLKNFENENGEMWRLDVETGKIVKGDNENFGLKKHWNRLVDPPDGYEVDWAEKQISNVDGPASEVVRKMIFGDLPQNISALSSAISFMTFNQPRLMRELEENHGAEIEDWSDDWKLIKRLSAALENSLSFVPTYYSLYQIDDGVDARFLTSSNPLIEPENQSTKLFPLSSKHCLFLSYDQQFEGLRPKISRCDIEIVSGVNKRTLENAWQHVYSSTSNFAE